MNATLTFSCFQIFFFTIMWVSKTLHPIYFESAGSLANFGLSYSCMALAGYFSFLTGSYTDRFGSTKSLSIGSMLYSIGLFARAFPESKLIAIVGGLTAGVGASMVLNSLRLWMLEESTSDNKARWVGLKSSTAALGTAMGCALAGFLPTFTFFTASVRAILMTSGIVLFLVGFIIFIFSQQSGTVQTIQKVSPLKNVKKIFSEYRYLSLFASCIGVLTGFYVSFVSPYLPLIMKEKGLSLESIGLSIGVFSLIRFFLDPMIAQWIEKHKSDSLKIFLVSEISILIVTGLFALTISKEIFIGFLVLRSIALGFSTISEELLWIQKFPRESVALFFGLSQSSFFLGDFLGGLLNGSLYQNFGLSACVGIAVVTIIMNAFLFILLFKDQNQHPITAVPSTVVT